jgi:3-hydroxyacyl-CoA dehydrogenase/enoyl-CoA hydratase/3-hydroxybutyryl-CoA epimerase
MTTYDNLRLDLDDGVAVVHIDVAGRPVNVFSDGFAADLQRLIEAVVSRDDIRGVVLTSAKPGGFMAGGDLKDFVTLYGRGLSAAQAAAEYGQGSRLLRRLETCGKPVAAAINGTALGGGYELALACHHRVLVDDPRAQVGLPEVSVGLLPGGGGTQRLPRLIGIGAALPLLLGGRTVGPAEALRLGLVDQVVPAEQLLPAARAWVLAQLHRGGPAQAPWDVKGFRVPGGAGALAPQASAWFGTATAQVRRDTQDHQPAPLAILSAVYEGTQLPIDAALQVENKYFGRLLVSVQARNLMRTGFLHRTAARKGVRRPAGVTVPPVRRLAVLGAGMMGAGIAQVAAAAGLDVVLLDAQAEAAERGKARAVDAWAREQAGGRCSADEAAARAARIHPTGDVAALAGCDFVIEAVFEDRAVKADLMARAQAALGAPGDAFVWASNTSTLPIEGLAAHWPQPAQVIGMHFFSPVPRMELVELILAPQTAPATLARAMDLALRLRKTPIVVHDSPGFYTSRIFCAYIDEGMAMLAEGVAPALIDNAARQAGFATGPLAVTDEVSLDLQQRVVAQAQADGLAPRFLRRHAQPVIERMNALGRLGRKTGGGFHDFPPGAPKRLWPGLAGEFPLRAEQPAADTVAARLLCIQALEAARCIEEGVVRAAADADVGATLGLGFPAWTGGPLSYIETVGLKPFVATCDQLADHHGERFRPSAWLRERAATGRPFHEDTPA